MVFSSEREFKKALRDTLMRAAWYLALINRAGGLYGRILTEVVSTDRTQWGLYTRPRSRFSHTDRLSSVNKMFIIWQKREQFNSFNVTGLYWLTFRFRTATSQISFFQVLLVLFTFFFSLAFCHLQKYILLDENSQWFCILVCNFFASKHFRSRCRSRWENLDRGQYPFQPIKFADLVVPSPCETEPYNNC